MWQLQRICGQTEGERDSKRLGIQTTQAEVSTVHWCHCTTSILAIDYKIKGVSESLKWRQRAGLPMWHCNNIKFLDFNLFRRAWLETNTSHTPTPKNTHCAFCLCHPHGAKQKSIQGEQASMKRSFEKHLCDSAPVCSHSYTGDMIPFSTGVVVGDSLWANDSFDSHWQ